MEEGVEEGVEEEVEEEVAEKREVEGEEEEELEKEVEDQVLGGCCGRHSGGADLAQGIDGHRPAKHRDEFILLCAE